MNIDMNIKIIDWTGKSNPDLNYAARLLVYTKNTRLEQGAGTRAKVSMMSKDDLMKELSYISKTIRSSWEFVDFTFEIKGVTRAFTHQLVRTRAGVSFAQQAQRVVDMSDFDSLMPDTIQRSSKASARWVEAIETIRHSYETSIKQGIPAQDARGILPTNVLTNIIMKINLRALADMVGKRENLRAQGEYADVVRGISELVRSVMPWTDMFLYPERKATPNLDLLLKKALGDGSPVDSPEVNAALKELDALKGTWG